MVRPTVVSVSAALALLCVGCWAQDVTECGDKVVVKDFNATQYMGKWYEYAKRGSMPYEDGGICVTAEYSMQNDNITVVNSMKYNSTHDTNSTTGWAEFASDNHNEGKLKVHFPNSPAVGNYWVLGTDYDEYSIVWSCAKHSDGAAPTEITWILLRSANYSNATLEKVESALKTLQLPMLDQYTKTEQSPKYCSGAEQALGAVITVLVASLLALLH